ncbi:MAG: hypothetical protein ABIF85_02240 [Nanoarchaeota archaeon]|nr:hypothetical protein [Nanoarchaeota archaeon]MBU4300409.1 hypothetical protein [Nanoarchaeota archaeon]MBU4451361.1 hypothetical protein [Nanoarchaeota archaeon]MCG2723764.1 hypothetical protein [archaeon]
MKVEPYVTEVTEAAGKYAKAAIERQDSLYQAILMRFAQEDTTVLITEFEFLKYIADERKIHKRLMQMEAIGLVVIHPAKDNLLRTPIYEITPLGKETAKILEDFEIKTGYPTTCDIVKRTLEIYTDKKYPTLAKEMKAIINEIISGKTTFEDIMAKAHI